MNDIKHVPAGSARTYLLSGDVFRFLVTSEESGGSYCTMEVTLPPGSGPDPHLHPDAEEQFYVLEGKLTFRVGDEVFEVGTGDLIHIPRGTMHSIRNKDNVARLLATFSPGIEGDSLRDIASPIGTEHAAMSDQTS